MTLGLAGLERLLPERPRVVPELIAAVALSDADTAVPAAPDPGLMQAGWHIYVEASTRLPVPELLTGPGALGEAIAALDILADRLREILKAMPPPPNTAAETIQALALRLLSEALQPFLTEWRPRYRRFAGSERAEAKWVRAAECRAALITTRDRCLPIVMEIGGKVGAPALSAPAAITTTTEEVPLQLPPPETSRFIREEATSSGSRYPTSP